MGDAYRVLKGEQEIDRFEVRDLRVKTRFYVDNVFIDEFAFVLQPAISMVYMSLVRHSNKGQKTWPSHSLVSREVGLSRQWVGTCIQILQCFNLIKSVRVGKRCTNRYYLVDEKLWRRDFDVMLKETEGFIKDHKQASKKVMSTELTSPLGDIRWILRLHDLLLQATSNSKGTQKDTKGRKELNTKSITIHPIDNGGKTTTNVEEEHIGTGSKVDTYFDPEKNIIVHRHYS